MHSLTSLFRVLLMLFMVLASAPAAGQNVEMNEDGPVRPSGISTEAVVLFHPDTARTTIALLYRIPRSFFTFMRTSSSVPSEQFEARGEISVEIFAEGNTVASREFRPIRLTQSDGTSPSGSPADLQGMIPFVVPAGAYHAVIEIRDLQSGRQYLNRSLEFPAPIRATGGIQTLPLLIVLPVQNGSNGKEHRLIPLNHGGQVPFGTDGAGVLSIRSADTTASVRLSWTLEGRTTERWYEDLDFSGVDTISISGTLSCDEGTQTLVRGQGSPSVSVRTVIVSIPVARLVPATYTWHARLHIGADSVELESRIVVAWLNRPLSLGQFDLAIEAMRHIASDDEMSQFHSLNSNAAIRYFHAFWQKRNPDTTRAFNPVMAEYFRRVDESIRQFSVNSDPNGFRSDRGRIFILNGAPSRTERSLRPGSSAIEIWTYDRLRKRYVFEDRDRTGLYLLIRMETL